MKKKKPEIRNPIQGESFVQPLSLEQEVAVPPTISSSQQDFSLCEADFLRITNGKSKLADWPIRSLFLSFGYALILLAKYFASKFTEAEFSLEHEDWIIVALGLVLAGFFWGLEACLPSDHKKVMKTIKEHFHKAPRTRHSGWKQP